MNTVKDVFGVWPSAAAMGRAINVRPVTVRQWRNRGYRVPSRYWRKIQVAALGRGYKIPLDVFVVEEQAQ
jgi:hypothetical protein